MARRLPPIGPSFPSDHASNHPEPAARSGVAVIYFFSKDRQYIRCEIYPGRPHVFTLLNPDGIENTEHYASAADLEARWSSLACELSRAGWSGPFGRDGR